MKNFLTTTYQKISSSSPTICSHCHSFCTVTTSNLRIKVIQTHCIYAQKILNQ
nr:hypothetical protein [uncultured Capnocytophaga sp.]